MSSVIVFEAIAVFVIWMQRKGRWAAFLQAASGQVVVGGADRSSGSLAYSEDTKGKVTPNAGTSSSAPGSGGGNQGITPGQNFKNQVPIP